MGARRDGLVEPMVDDQAQLDRYERLRHDFAHRLEVLATHDQPSFVRSDWRARNAELAAHLLPVPPRDLLRHPAIRYQMFVDERYLALEVPYVLAHLPRADLARESPVGAPPRAPVRGVMSSSNTVHHLHHLLRYADATGRALGEFATVVEWGGGYGNLAKLFLRLHGGAPTYVLLDTPVFAAVQWLYLAAVLGEDRVHLAPAPGAALVPGAVNVVPVGWVTSLDVSADLFVSTWALNESTPEAQHHVVDRDWFGADGLLLAMHRGDPLEPAVLAAGAQPVPVGRFMPAQRYLVR